MYNTKAKIVIPMSDTMYEKLDNIAPYITGLLCRKYTSVDFNNPSDDDKLLVGTMIDYLYIYLDKHELDYLIKQGFKYTTWLIPTISNTVKTNVKDKVYLTDINQLAWNVNIIEAIYDNIVLNTDGDISVTEDVLRSLEHTVLNSDDTIKDIRVTEHFIAINMHGSYTNAMMKLLSIYNIKSIGNIYSEQITKLRRILKVYLDTLSKEMLLTESTGQTEPYELTLISYYLQLL